MVNGDIFGSLRGKVAIVTGVCGAIGCAAATRFARLGAAVVGVDLAGAYWSDLISALPGDVRFLKVEADVTDAESVKVYVEKAVATFGRIDVFFNNAGIEGAMTLIPEYDANDFRKVLSVNVEGCFLGLKYVLPVMYAQRSGSVINTSSATGLSGGAGMIGYIASKHAVVGLTRVAAAESGPHGVRVNCVNPGPIEGRMMEAITSGQVDSQAARNAVIGVVPSGRYGRSEEVAALVAFLGSDAASYCNGGFYTVDGGYTAV